MASKHKQEDPWAGFVDVLSNILMVVIFLVVILGMSIFAISQQVTQAAVEKAVQAERAAQESLALEEAKVSEAKPAEPVEPKTPVREARVEEPKPSALKPAQPTPAQPKPSQPKPAEPTPAQPGAQDPATEPVPPQEAAPESGAVGPFEAASGLRARQADDVAGNTNLSVRSRETKSQKEIEVASEEAKGEDGAVAATLAQAFLSLKFSRGSYKIDAAASNEIQAFLGDDESLGGHRIEIRAFAQSTVGSVSEARRIAYYRAMQTRTELIKSGIAANKLEVKIRESVAPEEFDVVRIFAKP